MSAQSEILVNIRAVDKATSEMRRVQQATMGLQDSIRSLGFGSVLAYTSAGLALGEFARRGIAEIAEADRVNAQLNATLKSTGAVAGVTSRYLDDLAGTLGDMAAVDDEIVKGGEAVLLTFTNIRNVGADKIFDDAMTAALDLSRAFNQDLQSSVIQIGKALQDPIAGVTALRRVGVQLSADQEEQIRKFVEMNDVMSAQKVILGELQKEVGGSAKAYGETFSGQVARAKDRLDEFSGVIVGNTIVGLSMMFGWVTDVTGALGDLIDRVDVFGVLAGSTDDAARAAQAEAETWAWLHREMDTTATKAHSVQAELVTINGQLAQFGPMPPTVFGPTIEQAELLKQKADEARRAIFDAINLPSAERQQRELGLAQAQFNVGRLDQQREQGPLSPDREAWYQWLVNTFIPAQEEWLRIDELRINRDEAAADLTLRQTGNIKDMGQAIDGTLLPGLTDLNSGLYDTKDAMQGLKNATPANLKINLNPVPDVPAKAAKIRQDFRGETPGSFGVGLNPDFKVPTTAERWRTGFRGETPGSFGVGLNPDFKVPTTAERWRTGFRGETPAEFGVGLVETPTVPTKAQRLRTGFRGETPAEFGVGLSDPDVPGTAEGIRQDFRGETPASMGVGTYALDNKATVQAAIANVKKWWSILFGGGAGLGVAVTERTAAEIGFSTGWRPHNEQGMMPTFFTGAGGSTVMVGPVILNGIDIASPTGAAKFVDAIWPVLHEKLRRG